ncbi:MAG: Asp-tRNA(Asn)/Glu-tRNA(Gln) amidotransferase subunit GatC [Rhodospirillales bacterium]
MALNKEDVRKAAHLARIKTPEDRLDALAGELNAIIGWVEQLAEVDTNGVEPMTSVTEMTAPLREDAVTAVPGADAVLANAQASEDGFFTVPKVVE